MTSKSKRIRFGHRNFVIELVGTVSSANRKEMEAFILKGVPKLSQVRDQLPLDLSRFVFQVVPDGFDIAVHHTFSGACFYFANGMSAAQRATVRRLIDVFNPKSFLPKESGSEIGIIYCAVWSPKRPEQLFAIRCYYTLEGGTPLPMTFDFLPKFPTRVAEICGTKNVDEIYTRSAEVAAAAQTAFYRKGNGPSFEISGILFSPANEGDDLPNFTVDIQDRFRSLLRAGSVFPEAA